MNKKKLGIIITAASISIIAVIIGIIALLYFVTDIFKTPEQLFWKYASNGTQFMKIFSNENEINQRVWKNNHSYTSKGDLNILVTKEIGTQEIKLKTTAKHSQITGRTYSDITLYNEEMEHLKASYINNDNIYALYCKDIYEPYYIGIRNGNLKEFAQKMGITEQMIQVPDNISFLNQENKTIFTEEQIKSIYDIYRNVLANTIAKEKYVKTKDTTININNQDYQTKGYQIELNQEELKQVLIALLTETKENEKIINVLSEIFNIEVNNIQNIIEKLIINIQKQQMKETNFLFIVYQPNKNVTRIQIRKNTEVELILDIDNIKENKKVATIQINTFMKEKSEIDYSTKFTIEKQILSNMIIYTTNIIDSQSGYELRMNTSLGNISDDKIENNSKITIFDNDTTIETAYYKTIQATNEEVEIEELTNSNAIIVNNYPKEQLERFFTNIGDKTEQVITEKIEQLNLPISNTQDELYYLQSIISSVITVMNANGVAQPIGITGVANMIGLKKIALLMQGNTTSTNSSTNNTFNQIIEQEKQTFNGQFEIYKDNAINGTMVKRMISTVINSNSSYADNEERIVSIKIMSNRIKKPSGWNEIGEKEKAKLTQLSNNIQMGNQYIVAIEYDSKGLTDTIIIMDKEN